MLTIGTHTLRTPFMLAPMAGVSEQPFRVLAMEMGASLCPTELISSQGLMRANERSVRYLRHDVEREVPYCVQLFGGEPDAMANAAQVAQHLGAHIIDVNMGCPVKKVTKSGAGSALLTDPRRAAQIVRQIREATGLPVTAKIRSGWDASSLNYLDVVGVLVEAGCVALTMHPRTRAQGYSGMSDWTVIADVKRHFPTLPLVGNGDVKTPNDAKRMQETTGCDFVMVGRGALGNPWIFRELLGGLPPTAKERCEMVQRHFKTHLSFVGSERVAVRAFRKHLGWYAHGLRGASTFRNEVNRLELASSVKQAIEEFFLHALVEASPWHFTEV